MHPIRSLSFMCIALIATACGKDGPAPSQTDAATAGQVAADDRTHPVALDWPMPGSDPTPSLAAGGLGRGQNQGALTLWRRLSKYSGTFLKAWRQSLEAADMPTAGDVVDAFNELALAVTGPTGFWRKTVPNRWLGCDAMAESAPCKKVASLQKELEQWDAIQKQIENLEADQANQFLARNEARITLYLDTYVPAEPSADAMKSTPFYKKNLAEVLDTWARQPTGADDDL